MSHVIYNKETKIILEARARSVGCYISRYKTEGAAKAALTRLDKKGQLGASLDTDYTKEDFAIADAVDFRNNIDIMVTRRDAMTGDEFQESINTPYSQSRASEHYYCS